MDVGGRPAQHAQSINGEAFGYVVSHQDYGTAKYRSNANSALTLLSLRSKKVSVTFEKFDVQEDPGNPCPDYVNITGLPAKCGKLTSPQQQNIQLPNSDITFEFVTDIALTDQGFWLKYEGL